MSGVTVATMSASRSEGREAALDQRLSGSLGGEVAGGYSFIYDVALANAGALDDPVVGGFYHLFQIVVGQQARRDVGAQGSNLGAHELAHSMSSPDPGMNWLF